MKVKAKYGRTSPVIGSKGSKKPTPTKKKKY